ncbi:hypothetical protein OG233_16155 [Streptomyces sp. NBC_01218]|uniref:SEL1-like repeat protein n=1 Tax=Streptomyces sp. NBC_01218 TaxID=2903780 RepID=UPI002E10E153|nr:hypothetical protein OG233_16155 [Streptomyces sp. NBC_01218]
MSIVRILRSQAMAHATLSSDCARLLDVTNWAKSHTCVLRERASFTARQVEATNAKSEMARQMREAELAELADPPRPVSAWTPAQLGVHPSIGGLNGISPIFTLPKYITRSHDERLHAQLRSIVNSGGVGIILLRGESCTGKTRSAYEAVRACLPNWNLTFPKDSASLLSTLAAGAIEPRTVLWLNEAQNYFSGDEKERCATGLRRKLEENGPLVIILTLWPEHYRLLITESATSTGEVSQVKSLLTQASQFVVPNHLSYSELALLQRESHKEPPLMAALQSAGKTGRLTQILAAGPELVDHFEHPSTPHGYYGKALISAAMDARRLGVTEPLRLDFLIAAASGYLTDSQRAEAPTDWQERAVEYARLRVKNVTAAFFPVPKLKGIGSLPGVVDLADYLHYYGRKERAFLCPPDSFWEAAASWTGETESVERLTNAALQRLRIRYAIALADRAATLGSTDALWDLAFHYEGQDQSEKSETILRQLGEQGESEAWVTLASMKEDAGQIQCAQKLYIKAAEMGDFAGLRDLADTESINDHEEAALRIYRLLLSLGDTESQFGLASLLERIGDPQEAEDLYRKSAASGNMRAMQALERILESSGRHEEAANFTLPESLKADSGTLLELMLAYEKGGKPREAEHIFWRLIEMNEEESAVFLPWERSANDDVMGAERLACAAAERGFASSLRTVVVQLMRDDNGKDVERLIAQLSKFGEQPSPSDYSIYLERNGKAEQAEAVAVSDELLGDYYLLQLAKYRAAHGDVTSARKLTLRLIEGGDPSALSYLSALEEMEGNHAESERLALMAVDAGEIGALKNLLEKNPENESLVHLFNNGM